MVELEKLDRLSDKQLIKAFYALERWEWPGMLGEKPARWDKLPNYAPVQGGLFTTVRYRHTKLDIVKPIMDRIAEIIGYRWLDQTKGRNLSLKDLYDYQS